MTTTVAIALLIVLVALIFDFTNGFHDAANSIATVVSTRVLSPRYAVIWAATFNFIAFALFGTRVAKTIGGDLVRIDLIRQDMRLYVLCAGLMGAIIWNLITWYLGLPTSSSHAHNTRSEEHTSELQSRSDLVCRLLLEKKKTIPRTSSTCQGVADGRGAAGC